MIDRHERLHLDRLLLMKVQYVYDARMRVRARPHELIFEYSPALFGCHLELALHVNDCDCPRSLRSSEIQNNTLILKRSIYFGWSSYLDVRSFCFQNPLTLAYDRGLCDGQVLMRG